MREGPPAGMLAPGLHALVRRRGLQKGARSRWSPSDPPATKTCPFLRQTRNTFFLTATSRSSCTHRHFRTRLHRTIQVWNGASQADVVERCSRRILIVLGGKALQGLPNPWFGSAFFSIASTVVSDRSNALQRSTHQMFWVCWPCRVRPRSSRSGRQSARYMCWLTTSRYQSFGF